MFGTFWRWLIGLFHRRKVETYTASIFLVDKLHIVIRNAEFKIKE